MLVCGRRGSLEEKEVRDPVMVLALSSFTLGPGTRHLTSLDLNFLLCKESDLQDSFVLENYMIF